MRILSIKEDYNHYANHRLPTYSFSPPDKMLTHAFSLILPLLEAIQLYQKAIEVHCNENRIAQAAKLSRQIAETYEQDFEYTLAAKYYQEASDLYYAESDRLSDYNNMRLKVAELGVQQPAPDYVKSIKVGRSSIKLIRILFWANIQCFGGEVYGIILLA